MSNREILKKQIEVLPEEILSNILEYVQYQKFVNGIYENDTEYLESMPNMKESIIAGLKTPLSECSRYID